ncbi:hypothetical protein COO60DRAFT_1292472 [Scenedesmus sp. NREL 46B-D3]|nr:hypothetical protein COO60DRAFT_1292472 [Scenedesmus sp. NREL 46B-D3]
MVLECQELLALFGLPFIVAPAEAEAQCAALEAAGLVDGVVTDDNDVFLFGGQHVYRHLFEDKKYVEEYHMSDISRELGVDQPTLVCLAMLLGSDYTEGVAGIGVVNALEVLSAWPGGLPGLQRFKSWLEGPDERLLAAAAANAAAETADEETPAQRYFKSSHRGVRRTWHLPASFPSRAVLDAYLKPLVDRNTARFSCGRPDTALLQQFCRERFGWDQAKVDDLLLPVIRSYLERSTQTRIDQFLTHSQRFAKIRSKRMQQAVARITGVEVNPDLYYAETRHLPELPTHAVTEGDGSADVVGDDEVEARDGAGEAAAIGRGTHGARGGAAAGARGRGRGKGRKEGSAGAGNGSRSAIAATRGGGRKGKARGRGRAAALIAEEVQDDEDVGSAQSDLAFVRLLMQDGM